MPEAMMRKQLIRIGFSLAFPANCATLIDEPEVTTFEEAEQITPDQPVAHAPDIDINLMKQLQDAEIIQPVENTDGGAEDIIGKPQSNIPPSQDPLYNDVKPVPTAQTTPITNDQIGIIKQLSQYLPEGDDIQAPDYYVQAEEMIYKMKCEIGEMVVKKKSLKLNEDEIKQVFSGDNKFIVAIRKAALQALVDNKKK